MIYSTFLKRVLLLDGLSCLGMGAALTLGADALAPLFGIDRAIVGGAGVALLPIGAFVLWLSTRRSAPAGLVYLLIAGNAVWTVESFVLAGNTPGITAAGTAFVTAQAIAVLGLTALEWIGLRRSRLATA